MPSVTEAVGRLSLQFNSESMAARTSLSSPSRRIVLNPRLISSAPDLRPEVVTSDTFAVANQPQRAPSSSRQSSRPQTPTQDVSLHGEPGDRIMNDDGSTQGRHDRSLDTRSIMSWMDVDPSPSEPLPQEPRDVRQVIERLEQLRRDVARTRRRNSRPSIRGTWNATRGVFGYGPEGTAARKELVSLIAKMVFGMGQIATVISLLAIGAHTKSPTMPGVTEWSACNKPLGAWSAIWAVRVVLGSIIAIWGYKTRPSRRRAPPPPHTTQPLQTNDSLASVESRPQPPATPPAQRRNAMPARLGSLLSIISTCWFIVAHILVYTTIESCRFSAPHIWWLTFGIICIGYLVILELIVVIFVVFVLTPILISLINVVLICMGREPIRYLPQRQHETGKLSAKTVDRIPLVLYIPAPTPKEGKQAGDDKISSIALPEPIHLHSYPPQPERSPASPSLSQGTRVQSRSRRWFTFRRLRRKGSAKDDDLEGKFGKPGSTDVYEDKWERGDYPFVKLEDNRTTCAICLCDFEEPKRVRYSLDSRPAPDTSPEAETAPADVDVEQGLVEEIEDGELRLENPGQGAQPLRLLGCAHVFHKTCIDPWLTEVSGRCPICQRPVEVEPAPSNKRRRRR